MRRLLVLSLMIISAKLSFAGGAPSFNVVPTTHPNACNAIILENLASDTTSIEEWTFSPAAINAATGLPITSIMVDPAVYGPNNWPVVYWPASPAYSSLTIGYDGQTQDFNTCDCNAFAAGNFFDAPMICNTDHYCGNTAAAYQEDFMQGANPAGGLGANGDGCLFCPYGVMDHEGSIENNSWLKFIADSTVVDFDIEVFGGCYIQFAVYEYDPTAPLGTDGVLTLMTPMIWTNVDQGFTGANTISATGLTPGAEYYLHFDGHGGADCDYEIGFASGIVTIDALASLPSVCPGDPVTLTATPQDPSATYTWTDNFGNSYPNADQIVVNPTVPTTYTVEVLLTGCSNAPETVAVGIDPCPLPVEMVDFDVTCKENYTELTWQTASEVNNDYFVVQKADADFEFEEVETVQGSGTTNMLHFYSVKDHERNSGNTYYRIKQVDMNGAERYSEVISTIACDSEDFTVYDMYHNSETNEIVINFNVNRTTNVHVGMTDLRGKSYLAIDQTLEPNQKQIRIATDELDAGSIYLINLTSEHTMNTERIYIAH